MSKSRIEEIKDKYNTKEHEILRNTFGTPDTYQDIQTLLEEIDRLNAKVERLSDLEEQASMLEIHLKLISQMSSPMGFAGCPTIARQALEAYEAWKRGKLK